MHANPVDRPPPNLVAYLVQDGDGDVRVCGVSGWVVNAFYHRVCD